MQMEIKRKPEQQHLDKIDFKVKNLTRGKGHYTMIKGSIQEKNITIVNIYAPNIGAPQYKTQMLTIMKKVETDNDTIIQGEFNDTFLSMDSSFRQRNQ